MADVDPEEYEALKLRQIVMPQLEVKNDYRGSSFQYCHRFIDVVVVSELAHDVQTIFLDVADARVDLLVRWTLEVGRSTV